MLRRGYMIAHETDMEEKESGEMRGDVGATCGGVKEDSEA